MDKVVYKVRLKVGDNVMVRSGKYKGKTGKVTAVHPRLNKVTVEGINIVKRHVKPTKQQPAGGIVELTKPIWVSKLGIVEGASKKPKRIGYKITKDSKSRIYVGSGKEIK